ncbi:hypothetical protein [Gemmatimonas sp.]|uniref:hypothetical protein n=1 Tax=Gemmatimonas sp. TaxID=1962908 RepID=UPI00356470F1
MARYKHIDTNPNTKWVRTPERVTVFDAWGVASERGQWVGTWTEPDGPMVIGGNYEAQWRGGNGLWRLQGELFVPMRCDGGAYCRARPCRDSIGCMSSHPL